MKTRNNQMGFSLVELVIVMAILAIIGVAILSFFTVSSNSYRKTGEEADLQKEAQLTVNQIDNLIIDSTKELSYVYDTATSVDNEIKPTDTVDYDLVIKERLVIENENDKYTLEWDKGTHELTLANDKTPGEVSLMAKYVEDFKVSLAKDDSRIIQFAFKFKRNQKAYEVKHNVTVRNGLTINETPVTGELPNATWWKIDSVSLFYHWAGEPETAYVESTGSTISLPADGNEKILEMKAVINGINSPIQKVDWTILNNTDTTIVSTGENTCRVIIGASESASNIRVCATAAVKNEADLANASAITYIALH